MHPQTGYPVLQPNLCQVLHNISCYVGPCHHDMGRPRFADGGAGLQLWRVAAKYIE